VLVAVAAVAWIVHPGGTSPKLRYLTACAAASPCPPTGAVTKRSPKPLIFARRPTLVDDRFSGFDLDGSLFGLFSASLFGGIRR
jgi:hypothetical protein